MDRGRQGCWRTDKRMVQWGGGACRSGLCLPHLSYHLGPHQLWACCKATTGDCAVGARRELAQLEGAVASHKWTPARHREGRASGGRCAPGSARTRLWSFQASRVRGLRRESKSRERRLFRHACQGRLLRRLAGEPRQAGYARGLAQSGRVQESAVTLWLGEQLLRPPSLESGSRMRAPGV